MDRTKICDFPIQAVDWNAKVASSYTETNGKELGVLHHFKCHGIFAWGEIEPSIRVVEFENWQRWLQAKLVDELRQVAQAQSALTGHLTSDTGSLI